MPITETKIQYTTTSDIEDCLLKAPSLITSETLFDEAVFSEENFWWVKEWKDIIINSIQALGKSTLTSEERIYFGKAKKDILKEIEQFDSEIQEMKDQIDLNIKNLIDDQQKKFLLSSKVLLTEINIQSSA